MIKHSRALLEKAYRAMEEEVWIQAVRMNLCIVEEMLELLQAADDSDGTIGGLIEESLERIHEICELGNCLSQEELEELEELFHLLLNEAQSPLLKGWSDWQLALIESSFRLAKTKNFMREWEECVSRLTSGQENTWCRSYLMEQIAMIRYESIQESESMEQAMEYVYEHLQFSEFRGMAIQQALDNHRFEEAIRLAKEGEKQDQASGMHGLVKQWREFQYEAYQRSGQVEQQRIIGEGLVLDGDFAYYKQIKNTYSSSEWPTVYRSMLQKLEKERWPGQIYTKILIEEQETERLLAYVKDQPSRVEEFYPYLITAFPEEIKVLFQIHIDQMASQSSTRKDYQKVCRIIRVLHQAGGQAEAFKTVYSLQAGPAQWKPMKLVRSGRKAAISESFHVPWGSLLRANCPSNAWLFVSRMGARCYLYNHKFTLAKLVETSYNHFCRNDNSVA